MKKLLILSLILLGLNQCAVSEAAVVLTFDTDTQGVGLVDWNAANGSIAWSANHGGSLAITTNGPGWSNPIATLSLTSTPQLTSEFQAALANGGKLSFDYIVTDTDFSGLNNPTFGWFELVAVANSDEATGGGWDQNVIGGDAGYFGGIPSGTTVKSVVLDIAASAPAGDMTLNFGTGSGWNEVLLGFNSGDGAATPPPFTSATVYIDNLTVTANPVAVPEPTSLALLALVGAGVAVRAKSRKSSKA